jgi:hypothetical protein
MERDRKKTERRQVRVAIPLIVEETLVSWSLSGTEVPPTGETQHREARRCEAIRMPMLFIDLQSRSRRICLRDFLSRFLEGY